MAADLKLNLGCGNKHWEGFVNIDFPDPWCKKKPDVECDIRKLPYKDGEVDEIHAIHVIEHFYLWEVGAILEEWKRVLKKGGKLVLECPDLEKIIYWFNQEEVDPRLTFWALYGDPKYCNPAMCHKWAYTPSIMQSLLEDIGYQNVVSLEPLYHVKDRDMRVEAYA